MRFTSLSAAAVLLPMAGALAQPSPPPLSPSDVTLSASLRFEDFPTRTAPPPRNAPLILTRRDMQYRTRLRAAATERPNFAGHYVLVRWGCGTECLMGGAINTRTGRVTLLPFATCCFSEAPEGTEDMIAFRADSALLVLIGIRDERRADVGAHYYRIEGHRLVHLRDVPFAPQR